MNLRERIIARRQRKAHRRYLVERARQQALQGRTRKKQFEIPPSALAEPNRECTARAKGRAALVESWRNIAEFQATTAGTRTIQSVLAATTPKANDRPGRTAYTADDHFPFDIHSKDAILIAELR